MNPADKYVSYLRAAYYDNPDRKKDYIWGAQGNDPNRDGDKEWDCSGLFYGAYTYAGYKKPRDTANGYKNAGHKIAGPSQIGDYRLHVDGNGHATHIMMFIGNGQIIEAKGKDYGIVASKTSEGYGPWYRMDSLNRFLGSTTIAKPPLPPVSNPGSPNCHNPKTAPLVKFGSKSAWWVRHLQTDLNEQGFKLVVDGDFGPKTKDAVLTFQGRKHLAKDGEVGVNTWTALNK